MTDMPADRKTPDDALAIWVIYHRPKDFPDGYVLRCQYAMAAAGVVVADEASWTADSVEDLRKILPPGLVMVARHPHDDPHIVETWL